jgi:hypothetical protein
MSEPLTSTAPPRKRRRPALSCEQCRRRKIKCDRNYPCGQCLQSKTASCSYSPDTVRASRHVSDKASLLIGSSVAIPNRPRDISGGRGGIAGNPSPAGVSLDAITRSEATLPGSWTSQNVGPNDEEAPDPKALLNRIERVEEEFGASGGPSSFCGVFEDYKAHTLAKELRGTISKTRFFGPSHWMYSYGTV